MVYETFLETVRQSLQQKLSDHYLISLHPVPKNNGKILDGLSIQAPGAQMAPTIYLNSYYEQFLDGMTLPEIIDDILMIFENNPAPSCITAEQMSHFDLLKDKVMFKIIHAASNEKLLLDIPYIPCLDLAIVFYLFLERNETGQMTALICNQHLELWNVTEKDLFKLALRNTPAAFPACIKSMDTVMKEMAMESMGEHYDESLMDDLLTGEEPSSPLYVLTNQAGLNGAGCIFYNNTLKDFADSLGSDLVILPSSIHEVLLTPDNPDVSYEDLSVMVSCINDNEVPAEDQLSNTIYLYTRSNDKLQIAVDGFPSDHSGCRHSRQN